MMSIIIIALFVFIICLVFQAKSLNKQNQIITNKLNCSSVCNEKQMRALQNKNIKGSCLCVPDGFVSPEAISKKAKNMIIL